MTERSEHSWDIEDGWCHTHRAYCSMAELEPMTDLEAIIDEDALRERTESSR